MILADNVWFKISDGYYKLSEYFTQFVGNFGTAAGKFLYTTDVKTWAEADITAFGRTWVALSNAASGRSELGLGSTALLNIGTTQPWEGAWTVLYAEDGQIFLIINAGYTVTITRTTAITRLGTAGVTIAINGVALGGGAHFASTSVQNISHSSANVLNAGSNLSMTLSSTSSNCEGLNVTIVGTWTLV